jgi:hypothetical protein
VSLDHGSKSEPEQRAKVRTTLRKTLQTELQSQNVGVLNPRRTFGAGMIELFEITIAICSAWIVTSEILRRVSSR